MIIKSIFHQTNQNKHKIGSSFWSKTSNTSFKIQITGLFYQQHPQGKQEYKQFSISNHQIFYTQNNQNFTCQLKFCVLTQNFYIINHKKIYGISLIKQNNQVLLMTENQILFQSFYIKISQYCILTNFQETYRVKKMIGKGTFSKVYSGVNIYSNRTVALKIYEKTNMRNNMSYISLVKNQIMNLQKLRKHKLSALIQVYQTIDCVIIIQHKAAAGNMIEYLKSQQSNYNQSLIKCIIFQLLSRIRLLHKAGYIHRDIKPQNILFVSKSPQSQLFLSDFGLTAEKQQLKKKNIIHFSCGTVGYAAPQILNYEQTKILYNQSCDIFSVGCVFYFIFTGKILFQGMNYQQQLNNNKKCLNIIQKITQIQFISQSGIDLMKRLLNVNFKQRISVQQACKHEYFAGLQDEGEVIFEQSQSDIKYFIENKVKMYWENNIHHDI